jgi:hypothetical protein
MNEHPGDYHQKLCLFFSTAYEQVAIAERQASEAKMLASKDNMQAVIAEKHAKLAFRRFKATASLHFARNIESKQLEWNAKQIVAADICSTLLRRKAHRLRRLAKVSCKESLLASVHAAQLATSVSSSFNTVFSGNKAGLN